MTRVALLAVLVSACSSPAELACKDVPNTRLSDTPKLGVIHACAARLAPPCAAALARVTPVMTEAAGDAIFDACVHAYPRLAANTDRAAWFASALAGDRELDESDRGAIGAGLAGELAPPALVVHLRAGEIAIDDLGRWPVSSSADLPPVVAAMRAHGARTGGLLIWGDAEAPETSHLLDAALRGAGIPTVRCSPRTCR
jgi:hypothetical protein